MFKRFKFLSLLVMLVLPLGAQEKADTTYLFRFVPEKDMFYIPYRENGNEIQRLCDSLSVFTQQLNNGQMYVNVSSYAASASGNLSARRMAYLRNNRVKTELIHRAGLKESMFVTDRIITSAYGADSLRNVVVVTFPAGVEKVARIAGPQAAERVRSYKDSLYTARYADMAYHADTVCHADTIRSHAIRHAERSEASTPSQAQEEEILRQAQNDRYSPVFSLRANLLRWATLTPDLGVEWHINRNISILINGTWTSWSWNDKDRRYALWKVSPEIRYYIGKEKRGYLGAMYHIGEFNYKLDSTGKQGDYQGGGITGGYTLELNRTLSLDFHAALGYTYADHNKYTVTDGIRVKQGNETKNYWGINQLGITLVWKLIK